MSKQDQPTAMNGASMTISEQRKQELKQLFPGVFTETRNDAGELVETIDFERLKAELGQFSEIYDNRRERYGMDWPGKRDSLRLIQQPSHATLKPCREESVDFDTTENLFIEGDNLEVLKLLQKSYYGQVKMIYIDPPYNTGKEFIYPDNFAESLDTYLQYAGLKDSQGRTFSTNTANEGRFHTKWLNMMFPRLYLARNLLREDGVIFISIDEKESDNLLKLGCEIFGEENYVGNIVWKNSSKNDQAYISMQHEQVFCFVKNKSVNSGSWQVKKLGLEEIYKFFDSLKKQYGNDWSSIHAKAKEWYKTYPESSPIYSNKHYNWMDDRGVYFASDISGPNVGQYVYPVLHPVTGSVVKAPARGWSCPEDAMAKLISENLVHFGDDENSVPCLKTYLKDTEYIGLPSLIIKDGRAASKRLRGLFGEQVFTNPKDEEVLAGLIKAVGVEDGDTVLDFFAGSASFSHAASIASSEKSINIKSIAIQLPENLENMVASASGLSKKILQNAIDYLSRKGRPLNIAELSKERLRLTRTLLLDQYGPLIDNLGFKAFKLDQSNFKPWQFPDKAISDAELIQQMELSVDHVDPNASQEDLLYELLLKAGVKPTEKIDVISLAGHQVFAVAEGSLLVHLENSIDQALIDAVLQHAPSQFICLDKAFHGNDQLKTNAVRTFANFNDGKVGIDRIDFKTV